MEKESYCIIITTTNKKTVVDMIAALIIQSKLTTCVQVDKINSYFSWQKTIQKEKEYRLIIKAMSKHYTSIEEVIKNKHNYKVPQIIKLDISDGYQNYLKWISDNSL